MLLCLDPDLLWWVVTVIVFGLLGAGVLWEVVVVCVCLCEDPPLVVVGLVVVVGAVVVVVGVAWQDSDTDLTAPVTGR